MLSDVEGASVTRYSRPQVYSTAPPRRFALRQTGTLVALGLGALLAVVSWIGAVATAAGRIPGETGLILTCTLPIGLWLSLRGPIRIALSHRAVELDSSGLTLGMALGFAWPVRLSLSDVEELVIFEAKHGAEIVIGMHDDRSFRLDGRRFKDEAGFLAWWAENTAYGRSIEETVEPIQRIELEPPAGSSGTRPDRQRVEDVRAAVRRRTFVTISGVALAVLVAAAVINVYRDLRVENDDLVRSGGLYAAEVIDVVRSSRGPDEITVRFVADGTAYDRTITSPWFRGFRHGRWHAKALERGQWARARVELGEIKGRTVHIRREGDTDTHRTYIFSHHGKGRRGGEAWVSGYDRGLVVIFDDDDHWLAASLGKKSPLRQPVEV